MKDIEIVYLPSYVPKDVNASHSGVLYYRSLDEKFEITQCSCGAVASPLYGKRLWIVRLYELGGVVDLEVKIWQDSTYFKKIEAIAKGVPGSLAQRNEKSTQNLINKSLKRLALKCLGEHLDKHLEHVLKNVYHAGIEEGKELKAQEFRNVFNL